MTFEEFVAMVGRHVRAGLVAANGAQAGARMARASHRGSVPIGSPGVVRIWGNRASHGAPFADLDRLGRGDRIVLTTPADAVFTYVVASAEVVDVDTSVPPALRSTLVLSTRHVTTERELRVTAGICSGCPIDGSQGDGVLPTLTTREP